MDPYLMKFMAKYTDFNKETLQEIMGHMVVETYEKGTILLRQGDISSKCYLVLNGCVRQYSYGVEGKEITNDFFTEEQSVTLFKSYKLRLPSDYSLSCVEKTTLLIGDADLEEKMYEEYPVLQNITRSMLELNLGETQDASARFMSKTPEERYRSLVEQRPGLINRVPQHQLASYLGITPESLSRIKKRLSQDSSG
ncbi:cyclic nucleotide-binding domain-containing protein [Acetobacterium paludosum]|uniref:Cyclic nucleotide-binding domain-containing protein n=1 Tax=Acetobacterium paludosum TaxID=52693 RepID=A0A923HZI6_9FIRM|nr:Crp/Fnr family transcriptional regulator [Acetobacterium paludosum]MBC3887413.1 cyclic nucleotide-binding domain-containing protein [Acetobacterium paludosum]